MINAVIFDLDGVLVSTDEYHYAAWKSIADEEGIHFDRRINHRLRGVSRMASLDILLEKATRQYSDEEKLRLAETKNNRYRELLTRLTPEDVLPGVLEVLAGLAERGIWRAVGSSSRNAPMILERTGLIEHVQATADGNDISHSKPHPEVFLLAAERIGVNPAACLVVEDAPAGIEAGLRAGMHVLGIGNEQTLPGVTPRAASLADITAADMIHLDEATACPLER